MPLRKYLKRWADPEFWSVIAIAALWIFFVISLRHFWTDEPKHFNYKLIAVYVYIGCLLFACVVANVHYFYVFHFQSAGNDIIRPTSDRKNFKNWFSNTAFLFFVLAELMMMINALTMPSESKLKLKFCIEVFICLYIQAVTMQHRVLQNIANMKSEEKKQVVIRKLEGGCVTIPLKMSLPDTENESKSNKVQFKGPPASQPKGKGKLETTQL